MHHPTHKTWIALALSTLRKLSLHSRYKYRTNWKRNCTIFDDPSSLFDFSRNLSDCKMAY